MSKPLELRVLHLDDDPFELERVKSALERGSLGKSPGKDPVNCSFHVESVANAAKLRQRLATGPAPDVVILDIHIGDADTSGVELAIETRQAVPKAVILMCSTADDISTIADALNSGADDFISKQSDKGELSLRVYNSYRLAKLKAGDDIDGQTLSEGPKSRQAPVGATMEKIARRVPLIIGSAITAVFVRGESGTGKEVVVDRFGSVLAAGTPFVKVNCGAIAPTLLESELFGHVKGAFTGAQQDKRGLLEAASGGWIFLDEVATLSGSAQVALLRVLENQEVLRVGSTKPLPINVRVLSATNEPMERLVKEGRFRSDLWQRLRETEIVLPPLRERTAEIPQLVQHFCRMMPGGPYEVSGPVMEVLCNVSWREGNIRELRNCLRAMTEMHVDRLLTPLAVPERIWDELGDRPGVANEDDASADPPAPAPAAAMDTPAQGESRAANDLLLVWDQSEAQSYDYMADMLLLAMTRRLAHERGKLSLRSLASAIGMSRSTLSGRFKALVHRNIVELTELSKLVGISEK